MTASHWTLTQKSWPDLNQSAEAYAINSRDTDPIPYLKIQWSVWVLIIIILSNSHFNSFLVGFEKFLIVCLDFFFFNYVFASRRAKWLFLGLWKAVMTTLSVKIKLCMIRNNLIIQEFKMGNFALENRIGNPNHFGTQFHFGRMSSFVRLNMEIDHYCHLLANKPHDHHFSLFEQPYIGGRQDYLLNRQ